MQPSDEVLHTRSRVCVLIISKVPVELVDINIIPQALEWDVGRSIRIHDSLNDRDILIALAVLMEAKCPEYLHRWRAGIASLELANGF